MREIRNAFELFSSFDEDIFNTLITTLLCTFLVWYVQYHWKRRRLYRIAAQRKGPLALPFIGNALYFLGSLDDFVDKVVRLDKEYDTPMPIWMGQDLYYAITKPDDLEIVMNSPHALNKNKMYKFAEDIFGNGLFTSSATVWKRHRKIIMPTFNQKNLNMFVEIFSQQSEILLKQLEKELDNGIFNALDYVSRCTLDMFCETAMGIKTNAQTKESDCINRIHRFSEIIAKRMMTIFYHPDFIFYRSSLGKEIREISKKHNDFIDAIVREKRLVYRKKLEEKKKFLEAACEEDLPKRKIFLEQLVELTEEAGNFTDRELRDEVSTFIIAGSDTTSITNSFVLVMLGMFPNVQEAVYREVMDVLGPNKPVECQDTKNLHYLENVIKETMRLFPVGLILFREVKEDIKLEKCIIPAGCSALMSLTCHRNPNIWPDPFKFDPNRFLPEQVAKRHPYSWLPFSGGLRSCPGSNFAMISMKTLIATVVRRYQLFTDYKNIEDIKLKADFMLKPVNGFKLSLMRRHKSK